MGVGASPGVGNLPAGPGIRTVVFGISANFVEPVLLDRFFSSLPRWYVQPADFESIVALPTVPLLVFE